MKKVFLLILPVLLVIISCKAPEEIILPDKHLSVQNKTIFYKNEKYTGKIILPVGPKGNEGYMYVKDGHLDGNAEVKNEKDGFLLRYNISNGGFQDALIYKSGNDELILEIDKGEIRLLQLWNNNKMSKYDFTFTDGLANGVFEKSGQKFVFKNGVARLENENNMDIESHFSIDQKTWMLTLENFLNGKTYSKYEKFLGIDFETIENIVFNSIEEYKIQK